MCNANLLVEDNQESFHCTFHFSTNKQQQQQNNKTKKLVYMCICVDYNFVNYRVSQCFQVIFGTHFADKAFPFRVFDFIITINNNNK